MKKNSLLAIALLLTVTSCTAQKNVDLKNTKWVYDFGDGYTSYYVFLEDDRYEYHDAELGDILMGSYKQKKDTVILYQESGKYDSEFEEDSRHRTEEKQFKLFIKNNNELADWAYWDQNANKWKDTAFVFIRE